jgi:hypothetical protein
LIELAEENTMPRAARRSRSAGLVNMRLTPVCASSKLPRTAMTAVFAPAWVTI